MPFIVAVAITVLAALSLIPAIRASGRLPPALAAKEFRLNEEVMFLPMTSQRPPDEVASLHPLAPAAAALVRRAPPPADSTPAGERTVPRDGSRRTLPAPGMSLTPPPEMLRIPAPGMSRIPPLFPPAGTPRGFPCIGRCGTGTKRRFGEELPPQTVAERDSVIGAAMAGVPARAGPARPPGTIQIGLPGGGPTREQRQRAAALDADNRARLARIRARLDSAQLDSLRRDSAERARLRP